MIAYAIMWQNNGKAKANNFEELSYCAEECARERERETRRERKGVYSKGREMKAEL